MLFGSSKVRYLTIKVSLLVTRKGHYIQIFQHLSKPEALCIINQGPSRIVDIVEASKSSWGLQKFVETVDGAGCTVEVFLVSSHTISVEIGLKDFGALNVI